MDGHHLSNMENLKTKNTKYDNHDEVRPKIYLTIEP
jgi:hypothetical protein